MPNAAQVNFNTVNLTDQVSDQVSGVNFVAGKASRGQFNSPNRVINTWPDFVTNYGGLLGDSDATRLCKRMLDKGGSVRFCRIGHYTDITDPTTLSAEKAQQSNTIILGLGSDLVTDNVIDITLSGDAIDPVTFQGDQETTLENIQAAVQELPGVFSTSYNINPSGGSTIYITSNSVTPLTLDTATVTMGTNQATVVDVSVDSITDGDGNPLFEIIPKWEGEDFNNYLVLIQSASNGSANYFNLVIQHTTEPTLSRTYQNLIIEGAPTTGTSDYLGDVVQGMPQFEVIYKDLSYLPGPTRPINTAFKFVGGTDGDPLESSDYIGDSNSRTGFRAFDEYNDSMQLAVFDEVDIVVHTAGSAYAGNRKDLIYYINIDNSIPGKRGMLNYRDQLNIDSKFTYIYGGGLKVTDPITSQVKDIMGHGDLFANINRSDEEFGPWYSFAGPERGLINNVLGVVNNYGSPGSFKDLNDLANHQINMMINKDGSTKLWGNFSAQLKNNQEKFISIVRLLIYLQKSLRPSLETFLEEPNDIPTWKRIFYTHKPFMDNLVTSRALYGYSWEGDQDAKNLNNLIVNNANDVGNGKYKIRLKLQAIPAMQEITMDIYLAPTGVDFDDIDNLI